MKKCLLLFLFVSVSINAQIVNIPDANFKAKLLEASSTEFIAQDIGGNNIIIDSNGDGEIQEIEALEVYTLFLNFSNISDITGLEFFINLRSFSLYDNNVTTLPLATLINLEGFRCDYNQITSLDFTGLNNLEYVYCSDNLISTLDFSNNPNFYSLACHNNEPLTNINIKNGNVDVQVDSDWNYGNPNLEYVCSDFGEEELVRSNVGYSPNVAVNTYCSFTPGGNYNTIEGNILFDINNDGCDAIDLPINNVNLTIDDGTNQGVFISNLSGLYSFYTQEGSFELTPSIENPAWFNFSPISTNITFADNLNNVDTQDFCINAIGIHNDVEVILRPLTYARPGYSADYSIVFRNKGNQVLSGDINFSFEDSILDFLSSSLAPDIQTTGNLSWNYDNLTPFETRSILVTLNVNSPTDSPPVIDGQLLSFSTTVNPIAIDEVPSDNVFSFEQTAVNSFDPNDITCLEGDIVSPEMIGEYLHYNIRFENTGTAPATFIVVANDIDEAQYYLSTLQILNASHDMTTRIVGNKIEFIFDAINLPPDGRGNLLYKIKTLNTLEIGNSVSNKADIYFDYNFPIETNLATTTFQALSIDEFSQDNSVSLYPNPTSGQLFINSTYSIKCLKLYDIQGRQVQDFSISEENSIDIANLSKGIYFIEITTAKGKSTKKIVKD